MIQLACRSAKTLGEALLAVPALIGLFNVYVELTVTPGDEEWSFDHRIAGAPDGLSRHGNELWLATVLSQMKRVTGAEVKATRVWFGHPRPSVAEAVAQALGCDRVVWGAGSTGLAVSAQDTRRAILSADPVTAKVLERLATQVLERTVPRRGTSALVQQTSPRSSSFAWVRPFSGPTPSTGSRARWSKAPHLAGRPA